MPKSELSVWDMAKLLIDNTTKDTIAKLIGDLELSAAVKEDKNERLLVLKLKEELLHHYD